MSEQDLFRKSDSLWTGFHATHSAERSVTDTEFLFN